MALAEGYCAGDLNCRPRYKYHVKSPKYVSGNSQFFSKYLEKFETYKNHLASFHK